MTWRNSVNQMSSFVPVADISAYVRISLGDGKAPIDRYYESTRDILTQIDPSFFSNNPASVTSLLYIGLISATENYFRDVLGFILSVCPIAKIKAAEKKIQLGSFLWGGADLHRRTAFDFIAFSSAKNISDTFNEFVGYQVKQNGVWKKTLEEYDKLCEMRHGIVHSGMVLSGKNALKLGLPQTKDVMLVYPSYATLQEAGGVCTTLVQAANNELFEALVGRWAVDWRRLSSWNRSQARKRLKAVHDGFLSNEDSGRGAIGNKVTFNTLIRRIEREFNL